MLRFARLSQYHAKNCYAVRPNGRKITCKKDGREGENLQMTSQQKRMIELSDLVAFCFTCKKCGTCLSIPVASELQEDKPNRCPSCNEQWKASNMDSIARFAEFKFSLNKLSESIGEYDRFTLMLEIASDPSSTEKD